MAIPLSVSMAFGAVAGVPYVDQENLTPMEFHKIISQCMPDGATIKINFRYGTSERFLSGITYVKYGVFADSLKPSQFDDFANGIDRQLSTMFKRTGFSIPQYLSKFRGDSVWDAIHADKKLQKELHTAVGLVAQAEKWPYYFLSTSITEIRTNPGCQMARGAWRSNF